MNTNLRDDWHADPIVDWLLSEGRFLGDTDEITRQVGRQLLALGVPIWRFRLSMRALHPLFTATSSIWERDTGEVESFLAPHGLEERAAYVGSPLEIINHTRKPFRRTMDRLTPDDHEVLFELKARGGTDYYGTPMLFSNGSQGNLIFTTDTVDGFSDCDITQFDKITPVLALISETIYTRQISLAVAEAYLGSRTGRRVLDGQITRGHIETINAAILVSDIRGWTDLNNRLPAAKTLALANAYFEIIARAVEAHDGEVLKFIGDGVLAIFPTGEGDQDPASACQNALLAARQSLSAVESSDHAGNLRIGVGLHFGEVLYGNVGSETRIDFTVLGQAVNIAARIEGLCDHLKQSILFSQSVAEQLDHPARRISTEMLKGSDAPFDIFISN